METISKEKVITVKPADVKADAKGLVIKYKSKPYTFTWKSISKKLATAHARQRGNFFLSASGYGIHWPDLDEDISISALLKTKL
jgi:hypothetical protein